MVFWRFNRSRRAAGNGDVAESSDMPPAYSDTLQKRESFLRSTGSTRDQTTTRPEAAIVKEKEHPRASCDIANDTPHEPDPAPLTSRQKERVLQLVQDALRAGIDEWAAQHREYLKAYYEALHARHDDKTGRQDAEVAYQDALIARKDAEIASNDARIARDKANLLACYSASKRCSPPAAYDDGTKARYDALKTRLATVQARKDASAARCIARRSRDTCSSINPNGTETWRDVLKAFDRASKACDEGLASALAAKTAFTEASAAFGDALLAHIADDAQGFKDAQHARNCALLTRNNALVANSLAITRRNKALVDREKLVEVLIANEAVLWAGLSAQYIKP